jgi:hypothetical protein
MFRIIRKIVPTLAFVFLGLGLLAQGPPDPPGVIHGNTEDVGGAAPIGSGIGIMLMLAAGYGAKKIYDIRKKLEDLEKLED